MQRRTPRLSMHTTSYPEYSRRISARREGLSSRRSQVVARLLLVLAIFVASASALEAATVTATWDPNPEPDIQNYVLSWGTVTGQYPNSVNVGNVTTWQLTLSPGQYFFIVQA